MATSLLIENESELAPVAYSYLEKAGLGVINAACGYTGLWMFRQSKSDLVFWI